MCLVLLPGLDSLKGAGSRGGRQRKAGPGRINRAVRLPYGNGLKGAQRSCGTERGWDHPEAEAPGGEGRQSWRGSGSAKPAGFGDQLETTSRRKGSRAPQGRPGWLLWRRCGQDWSAVRRAGKQLGEAWAPGILRKCSWWEAEVRGHHVLLVSPPSNVHLISHADCHPWPLMCQR